MQLEKITAQLKLYLKHHVKTHTQEQEAIHNLLHNCIIDLQEVDSPPKLQTYLHQEAPTSNISQQVL